MGEAKRRLELLAAALEGDYGTEARPMTPAEWRAAFDAERLPNRAVYVQTSDGAMWRYPGPFELSRKLADEASREKINPERRWCVAAVDRASGVLQLLHRNLRSEEATLRLAEEQRPDIATFPSIELLVLEADLTGRFLRTPNGDRNWRHPDELPGSLPG